MRKKYSLVKSLFLIGVICLTYSATSSIAEEIKLTTIMPKQDILRGKDAAVGATYQHLTDTEVDDGNLFVEGKVGIGATTPIAKLDVLKNTAVTEAERVAAKVTHKLNVPELRVTNTTKRAVLELRGYSAGDLDTNALSCGTLNFLDTNATGDITSFAGLAYISGRTDGVPPALCFWAQDLGVTMAVTTDGNHRVGIGTVVPNYRLHVEGKIYSTNGSICASDIRWKENIETLPNPLEGLLKLRGAKFDWKLEEFKDKGFSEGRQIGIIAQEMEEEFPELVSTDDKGYKSIAYDKFTVVLLEAIKELKAEIDQLKAEITVLKAKQ